MDSIIRWATALSAVARLQGIPPDARGVAPVMFQFDDQSVVFLALEFGARAVNLIEIDNWNASWAKANVSALGAVLDDRPGVNNFIEVPTLDHQLARGLTALHKGLPKAKTWLELRRGL